MRLLLNRTANEFKIPYVQELLRLFPYDCTCPPYSSHTITTHPTFDTMSNLVMHATKQSHYIPSFPLLETTLPHPINSTKSHSHPPPSCTPIVNPHGRGLDSELRSCSCLENIGNDYYFSLRHLGAIRAQSKLRERFSSKLGNFPTSPVPFVWATLPILKGFLERLLSFREQPVLLCLL